MGLKQDFNALPTPIKWGIYGLGAFGLYKGGKYAMKKLGPAPPGAKAAEQAKTEAEEILKNNKYLPPAERTMPTFTPSQMSTFADTLFSAMDGGGTDEEAIESIFKQMRNDLDILLIIDAFGVRDDDNLAQWLRDDGMTASVNKILSTKSKISKRF